MAHDPAIDVFIADAKRLGLSPRQYEQKFHIQLMPSEQAIRQHETTVGDLPVEAFGISTDDPDIGFDPVDTVAEHLHRQDCAAHWYDCQAAHRGEYEARAAELLDKREAQAA